ncbi:MAG: hypothetical protein KDD46_05510 [Bdellovibrionales bacterium]|nr:hypothetical protein [Bdellovibrionales bacterium]
MKKKSKFYQMYVFFFFLLIFLAGGFYNNCGTIETGENVRQKIFIDEVDDIYPARLCEAGENCSDVNQRKDGSYELTTPNLE